MAHQLIRQFKKDHGFTFKSAAAESAVETALSQCYRSVHVLITWSIVEAMAMHDFVTTVRNWHISTPDVAYRSAIEQDAQEILRFFELAETYA